MWNFVEYKLLSFCKALLNRSNSKKLNKFPIIINREYYLNNIRFYDAGEFADDEALMKELGLPVAWKQTKQLNVVGSV